MIRTEPIPVLMRPMPLTPPLYERTGVYSDRYLDGDYVQGGKDGFELNREQQNFYLKRNLETVTRGEYESILKKQSEKKRKQK